MVFNDFTDKQNEVEKSLRIYLKQPHPYNKVLYNAMSYSLFAEGKRFRPILLLMAYESIDNDFKTALPTACAIEYIHTYSLIHDDLPSIDNDDFRRGKPTCHKQYGEAVALLAGDGLFAEAFNLISEKQKAKSKVLIDVIKELASASGASGMVGGQVVDVLMSGEDNVTSEQLSYIHSHKTGKLIIASAKIGALLAGASKVQIKAIEEYSYNLGMAFQIYDDILDEIGDSEKMGKMTGSDKKHNKATYPSIFGLEKAKEMANKSCEKAISSLDGLKDINLKKLAKYVVGREN